MATSTSKEYVQRGIYVDYSRPWGTQTQYLCSSFVATVCANSLSILVTLAAARLFRLVHHMFAIGTGKPIHGGHTAPERLLWDYILEHRADLPSNLHLGDVEINRMKKWKTPIVLLLLAGAFLAILSVGVLTAKIVTGSSALSRHPACGIYEDGQHVASNRSTNISWVEAGFSQYRFDAEIESAAYAQRCYHPQTDAGECDFFLQQSIPYTTSEARCPFLDPSMCDLPGKTGAIYFSTGAVDSRILGLNAPRTLQFRRNATCSPVVVNETFVDVANKGNLYRSRYYYGDLPDNPHGLTYTSHILDPSIWVLSDYTVYVKMLRESDRLPGLRTNFAFNSGLSLIFINQGFLDYPRSSSDPVFPASSEHKKDNWKYFYNARSYNSILGCVDTIEFKIPFSAYQSDQWFNYGDLYAHAASLKNAQERGTALLLERALMNSYTGQSIFFRQEDGLLARKLVKGHLSMALAEEQWKEEARNLFETSLARIQLDIKLMAFGNLAAYNGTRRVLGQDESICGQTFLFHSRESQNINLSGLIWITVVSSIIIILAVPLRDEGLLAEWLWTALSRCGLSIKQSANYLVVNRIAQIPKVRMGIALRKYRRRTR